MEPFATVEPFGTGHRYVIDPARSHASSPMLLAIKQAQADLADLWKPDIPIRDLFADIAAWCDTHDLMSTHVVTIFANLLSECTARMVHEMSLTAAREFMAQVINVLHDVRDAVLDNEMPGVRIPVEVPEEEESRE